MSLVQESKPWISYIEDLKFAGNFDSRTQKISINVWLSHNTQYWNLCSSVFCDFAIRVCFNDNIGDLVSPCLTPEDYDSCFLRLFGPIQLTLNSKLYIKTRHDFLKKLSRENLTRNPGMFSFAFKDTMKLKFNISQFGFDIVDNKMRRTIMDRPYFVVLPDGTRFVFTRGCVDKFQPSDNSFRNLSC